nr:hypothetical protein [Methanobrevibacter arboriphilus]
MILSSNDLSNILNSVHRKDSLENSKLVLNNCIFDIKNRKPIKSEPIKYFSKNKFSIKNFNFSYKEVDYCPNHEDPNIIQKTLQEILIPKYDLDDKKLYFDYLERFGASFLPDNYYKIVNMYKSLSDSGNTILNSLLSLVFADNYCGFTPQSLDDKTYMQILNNKNVLAADELKPNSFKGKEDIIKRMSSGETIEHSRKLYTNDAVELNNFGTMWLFTNEYLDLKYSKDPGFLNRLDVFNLPNVFVNNPKKPNEHKKIPSFYDKCLKNNLDGIEWLANASLSAYSNMIDEDREFTGRQSKDETLNVIKCENPLFYFLSNSLEVSGDLEDYISNEELREGFESYVEGEFFNFNIPDPNRLSSDIGRTLKSMFPNTFDKRSEINGKMRYNGLKFKED